MNENLFEINYSKYIEPIYTNPKNRKNSVDSSNEFIYTSDHKFKISFEDRVDMTMYETYSIDQLDVRMQMMHLVFLKKMIKFKSDTQKTQRVG